MNNESTTKCDCEEMSCKEGCSEKCEFSISNIDHGHRQELEAPKDEEPKVL